MSLEEKIASLARVGCQREFRDGATFAFFVLALPSILAFWFAKHVPFPTLFRTVANLGGHVQMIATAVLAFLVALGLHLSFYPWSNTAHVLQADHRIAPSRPGRVGTLAAG